MIPIDSRNFISIQLYCIAPYITYISVVIYNVLQMCVKLFQSTWILLVCQQRTAICMKSLELRIYQYQHRYTIYGISYYNLYIQLTHTMVLLNLILTFFRAVKVLPFRIATNELKGAHTRYVNSRDTLQSHTHFISTVNLFDNGVQG